MPDVVMVIAHEIFRDEEYEQPKQVLEARGAAVTTASTAPGQCIGKLGMIAQADLSIEEALGRDWDAVVFVGGGGAQVYFDDPKAHALARLARDTEAILAAICIGPSILAHAGLLVGCRATAFPSQEQDLTEHGATWTGEPVTVDGLTVTANGPEAAHEFGEAIAQLLGL